MNNDILYKVYLLRCMCQDIDSKIDNKPMNYEEFCKQDNVNKNKT